MKISTLEQLRCIQSDSRSPCHGPLEVSASPVAPRFDAASHELIEGILQCRNCNASYPVISGVAILLPRLMSWCREHYHYIQNGAAHTGCIGSEMQHWLADRQWQLGNHPADNYYESERWINIFTATHYDSVSSTGDDVAAAQANSTMAQYIEAQPQVFEVAEQMIARQLDTPVNRALDIGTNVGGMALRLAPHAKQIVGIDTAFNAILTARMIQCGAPVPQTSYRRYHDGHHYEERRMVPQISNSEFLVASVFDLPLDASWDLVTALNVIDVVDDPRAFLDTLAGLVSEGGLLLLSSPYSWGSDDVPIDNWLGASAERPSDLATREAIEQLGFSILEEVDDIPWVLREHQRWYRVFMNHCILARKQARI